MFVWFFFSQFFIYNSNEINFPLLQQSWNVSNEWLMFDHFFKVNFSTFNKVKMILLTIRNTTIKEDPYVSERTCACYCVTIIKSIISCNLLLHTFYYIRAYAPESIASSVVVVGNRCFYSLKIVVPRPHLMKFIVDNWNTWCLSFNPSPNIKTWAT